MTTASDEEPKPPASKHETAHYIGPHPDAAFACGCWGFLSICVICYTLFQLVIHGWL